MGVTQSNVAQAARRKDLLVSSLSPPQPATPGATTESAETLLAGEALGRGPWPAPDLGEVEDIAGDGLLDVVIEPALPRSSRSMTVTPRSGRPATPRGWGWRQGGW